MTGARVTKITAKTTYLRQVLEWLQSYWTD